MSTQLETVPELAVADDGDHGDESQITGLMRLAIEKEVPVELLERLVALQERISERNARAAFFDALARFQSECPEIDKNKTANAGQYSYSYADLSHIARVVRPVLRDCGLSYSWDSTADDGFVTCVCTLRHIGGHSETASFAAPTETRAKMSGAQRHAAALTYARRQSLVQVLGLSTTDEDVDGRGHVPENDVPISEREYADMIALMEETNTDPAKFLGWFQTQHKEVEDLESLPGRLYGDAIHALNTKRSKS